MPHIHVLFIYAPWGWMGSFSQERILGILDDGRRELEDAWRPTWVVRSGLELVGVRFVADGQAEVRLLHLGAKASDGRHAVEVVALTLREYSADLTVNTVVSEGNHAAAK